jgi:orotidine-5'-phosphate decarboxylase
MKLSASEKLQIKNKEGKFICIGLDTDINKLPEHLLSDKNPVLTFNKSIIEATSDNAAAYKLNFAFYEKDGIEGFRNLKETISFIPEDCLIIGDAKRGDIGNTSQMYADALFEYFGCDASTLHPYMGKDSIQPFLIKKDKLNFILALTSNPGADDFEKLQLWDGSFLFQKVISKVKEWNEEKNCGIVFGATRLSDLKENINSFDDLPVLLPGVGAQGGSFEDVVKCFNEAGRKNYLVNISRGIIYLDHGKDFALKAGEELQRLNRQAAE